MSAVPAIIASFSTDNPDFFTKVALVVWQVPANCILNEVERTGASLGVPEIRPGDQSLANSTGESDRNGANWEADKPYIGTPARSQRAIPRAACVHGRALSALFLQTAKYDGRVQESVTAEKNGNQPTAVVEPETGSVRVPLPTKKAATRIAAEARRNAKKKASRKPQKGGVAANADGVAGAKAGAKYPKDSLAKCIRIPQGILERSPCGFNTVVNALRLGFYQWAQVGDVRQISREDKGSKFFS